MSDPSSSRTSCIVVGSGRAGQSFRGALTVAGWHVELVAARRLVEARRRGGSATPVELDSLATADLVLLAVPDRAISEVSAALPSTPGLLVHI